MKAEGDSCEENSECESTWCVDNVCCNHRCNSACQACSRAARRSSSLPDGVCGPVPVGSDPEDECDVQEWPTCGTTGYCNGAGACATYSASTECRDAVCHPANATVIQRTLCDGNGSCRIGNPISENCTPYTCSEGACRTSCNLSGSGPGCAPSFSCIDNKCRNPSGFADGALCSTGSQCASGYCTHGVCCASACKEICRDCSGRWSDAPAGTCGNVVCDDPQHPCKPQGPYVCVTGKCQLTCGP
jgi:hypothetical protein